MAQQLVSAGGAEFYVEVADTGGPTVIRGDGGPMSFDGVRATVEGIAAELAGVWQRVRPSEASVEFALRVTARAGKLTGLVVEGGGEAALTVRLTWKQPDTTPGRGLSAEAEPGPEALSAPDPG